MVELSYGLQPLRWLGLRATVQYIVDPGAFGYRSTPDALALGTGYFKRSGHVQTDDASVT